MGVCCCWGAKKIWFDKKIYPFESANVSFSQGIIMALKNDPHQAHQRIKKLQPHTDITLQKQRQQALMCIESSMKQNLPFQDHWNDYAGVIFKNHQVQILLMTDFDRDQVLNNYLLVYQMYIQ